MAPTAVDAANDTTASELDRLVTSWKRHLRAQHASRPATIATYGAAVGQLGAYLGR